MENLVDFEGFSASAAVLVIIEIVYANNAFLVSRWIVSERQISAKFVSSA